jgi:hypothetical protein
MDIALTPDIANDPEGASFLSDLLHRFGGAGYKGNACAAADEKPDNSQPKPGRPARYGHAKFLQIIMGWHRSVLLCNLSTSSS